MVKKKEYVSEAKREILREIDIEIKRENLKNKLRFQLEKLRKIRRNFDIVRFIISVVFVVWTVECIINAPFIIFTIVYGLLLFFWVLVFFESGIRITKGDR